MPNAIGSLGSYQKSNVAVAMSLFALSLALRLPQLDAMVNVDMYHLWAPRIIRFWQSLAVGDLGGTYQTHHPGVTFMWATGGLWSLFGITTRTLDPFRLTLATLPIAFIGALFPVTTYWLTLRAWGREQHLSALLIALLFATEPLFIAHSRNAHLDMLVTSFAWSSLLTAIVALRSKRNGWAIASGVLLGLALLTKLSAAGYALGIALLFFVTALRSRRLYRPHARLLMVLSSVSALTVFALWPALWVAPIATLTKLHEGLLNEVDKASVFMFLGHTGQLALPSSIYGIYALFLTTPEFVLPAVFGAVSIAVGAKATRRQAWFITLGTAPLAALIFQGSRVGARYLIPLLPWLGTVSALAVNAGFSYLREQLPRRWATIAVGLTLALFLAWRVVRVWSLHPLPITYCSKWTQIDCASVFHLGWGEGLKEAARYIEQQQRGRFGQRPIVIYGSPYASLMGTWTNVKSSGNPDDAELLVVYLPDFQRNLKQYKRIAEMVRETNSKPLHEVVLEGRSYVRIYAGPKF